MLVKVFASATHGVDAQTIDVEVNSGGEIPAGKLGYFLVGLPDNAVKEGYMRIEAAAKNSGMKLPDPDDCQSCPCRYPKGRSSI